MGSAQLGQAPVTLPFMVKINPYGAVYLLRPIRKLLALESASKRVFDAKRSLTSGRVVASIEIPVSESLRGG